MPGQKVHRPPQKAQNQVGAQQYNLQYPVLHQHAFQGHRRVDRQWL